MAAAKKPVIIKAISDVAQPGESAPSETARPVIITKRSMVVDPMVKSADVTDAADAPIAAAKLKPQTLKAPLSAAFDADKKVEPAHGLTLQPLATSTIEEPKAESPAKPQSTVVATAPAAPSTVDVLPVSKTEPVLPQAKTGQADSERDQDIADQEKAEAQAKLQKMIDEKTFFLPINSLEKRRTKRFVVLGAALSIVLAIMWVDVALDSGIIHLGRIKSVTHFFNQTAVPRATQPTKPAATAPITAPKVATVSAVNGVCPTFTATDANAQLSPYTSCFDHYFASCSPVQITVAIESSFGKGTSMRYQVESKQGASCLVQWQYIALPDNPALVGKTVTCPYDPTKEFLAALAANTNFSGCSGPLLTSLSN